MLRDDRVDDAVDLRDVPRVLPARLQVRNELLRRQAFGSGSVDRNTDAITTSSAAPNERAKSS